MARLMESRILPRIERLSIFRTHRGWRQMVSWGHQRVSCCLERQALVNHGYDTGGVDGVAGNGTFNAVLAFQSDRGLLPDGMVGPHTRELLNAPSDADGVVGTGTWNKLFEVYRVPVSGTGVERFVNVAQYECDLGFQEDNSNNITPYGQWYGLNEQPWCAMFVSWCAFQAGILNSKVPMFAYCPYGVSDYIARGKYYSRNSSYIPRRGDTIFFIDADDDTASHTGIFIAMENDLVKAIEGNKSDRVGIHYYDKNNPYILGYGCNDGEEVAEPVTPTLQERKEAVAKKVQGLFSSLNITCSRLANQLTFADCFGMHPTIKVEYAADEATVALAPNLELVLSSQCTESLYLSHAKNENAIPFSIKFGELDVDELLARNKMKEIAQGKPIDISPILEIFDTFCVSFDTGVGVLEFETGTSGLAPYIQVTMTIESTAKVGAHYEQTYSFGFGIRVYANPPGMVLEVITEEEMADLVARYEQRAETGFVMAQDCVAAIA